MSDTAERFSEGEVFYRFKLIDKAVARFEEVLRVDPDHSGARWMLRLCRGDETVMPEMVAAAEALIARGEVKEGVWWLRTVALSLQYAGRVDDCIRVLTRVWYLAPEDQELARALAEHELARDNARGALQFLQASFKLTPEDPDTLVAIARCFEALGKSEHAARCFEEASRVVTAKGDASAAALFAQRAADARLGKRRPR